MADKNSNADSADMAIVLGFGLAAILLALAVQFLRDDVQRIGMTIGWAKAQVLAPIVGGYHQLAGCDSRATTAFLQGEGGQLLALARSPNVSEARKVLAREEARRRLLVGLGRGPLSRCYPIGNGQTRTLFHAILNSYSPSQTQALLDRAYRTGFSREDLEGDDRFARAPWLIDEVMAMSATAGSDEVQGSRGMYSQLRRRLSGDPYNLETEVIDNIITELRQIRPARIEEASTVAAVVTESTGRTISLFVYVPLLGFAAIWIFFLHTPRKLKRKLNLEAFASYQSKVWHAILPAVVKDPMQDKEGIWRESMTPEEWLDEHKILVIDGLPDREGVREAFVKQLKHPFRGTRRMAPHRQVLVAVFALQAARKISDGREILALCSKGWSVHGSVGAAVKKDPELKKRVEAVLNNNDLMDRINQASRLHAYEETVLASMLEFCRVRGGVLASAEFLWLKPEDRPLWYVMNDVGRPTFHVESAGVIAHYKAEKASRRPLPEPDVDEAVFGLEEHMQSAHPSP